MGGQGDLADLLMSRVRWFEEALIERLHHAGLTGVTRAHSVVAVYIEDEGTRESELARRAGVSRQSMHKAVKELRAQGFVELRPDPANASAKLVTPTGAVRAVLQQIRAVLTDLEGELARRIGVTRTRQLRETLQSDWGPVPQVTSPIRPRQD